MVKQVVRPAQPSALKRVGATGLDLLIGGRDRLRRQWSSLREEGRNFLPALTEEFESSVNSKMLQLTALEGVEQTTRVTVEDAARCYYTEHWPILLVNTFRGRRVFQAVVLLVGLAFLVFSLRLLPHPPSVISRNFLTVLASFFGR